MLLSKIGWTLILAAVLLVPLWSIEAKIEERRARALQVVQELADTGVGEQTLSGPVLVIPCTERYRVVREDAKGKQLFETLSRSCTERFVATALDVTGGLQTEVRTRGIYRALFYAVDLSLRATFDLPPRAALTADVVDRTYGNAELRLGIADVRGIDAGNVLRVGTTRLPFAPGSNDETLGRGIHAQLPNLAPGRHQFDIRLPLRGTSGLQFLPLARDTRIDLHGSWPHPSFAGRFLPQARRVRTTGFTAQWRVSELASEAVRAYFACTAYPCAGLQKESFGVSLIEPVDLYTQSLRAADYGFLFVGLTFLVFLLFEFVAALRLHALQYALVGLALAVFFLLLFALAEHVAFEVAYTGAAAACIALIGFYVSHMLGSARRAALFCLYLIGLYGALYMLLRSEDSALLLGAILVFAVLALTMVLTRRLDWFALAQARLARPTPDATVGTAVQTASAPETTA